MNKKKGSFCIKDLGNLNKALLGKSDWRYTLERELLQKWVTGGKYGEAKGEWYTHEVMDGYGVGLWKTIRRGWGDIESRTFFEMGNGKRVKFWKDTW